MSDTEPRRLSNVITDPEELWTYLKDKANRHNSYKHYTTADRIQRIVTGQSILLSRGEGWNDLKGGLQFLDKVDGRVRFGACFSYSISENIAMWMLYGRGGKNGAMLDLTPTMMKSIVAQEEFELGHLETDNAFVHGATVRTLDDCTFYLVDVLYCGESNGEYTLKRSDERVDHIKDLPDSHKLIVKSYPWSYENEVRLILEVPEQCVPGNADFARISLKTDEASLKKRIYVAPNNEGNGLGYCRSRLKGKVDWDICQNCSRKAR